MALTKPSGKMITPLVNGTVQAATSGTAIDFTSIPAGVKRITVMFVGVSTDGTSDILVQIGDAGGIENSGYSGAGSTTVPTTDTVNSTAGFIIPQDAAGQIAHGALVLSLVDAATFSWVAHGVLGKSNTADMVLVAGSKSLSAELDRLRVTTVSGSGNFDAGTINIQYEF
jgi:hypothetical protein